MSARERREELKELRTSGKSDTSGKRAPSGRRRGRRRRRAERRERESAKERRLRKRRERREEKQDVSVPVHPDEERVLDENLSVAATEPTIDVTGEPTSGVEALMGEEIDAGATDPYSAAAEGDLVDGYEEEVYEHPTKPGAPLQTGVASAIESHIRSSTWEVGRPTSMGGQPREGTIGRRLKDPVEEKIGEVEAWSFGLSKGIREEGYKAGARARELQAEGRSAEAAYVGLAALGLRLSSAAVEEMTFPVRPRAWVRAAKGVYEGAVALKDDPTGTLVGVAEAIAHDPGIIAEIGASVAVGWVGTKAVQVLRPTSTQLSRLDDLDVDVVRIQHELTETPQTGGIVKAWEGPEAQLKGTVMSKRVPDIVGEIMEEELKDVGGSKTTTLFAVEDAKGVTSISKVDLPTDAVDGLLKGKGTWLERQRMRFSRRGRRTTRVTVGDEPGKDLFEHVPGTKPGKPIDVELIQLGEDTVVGIDKSMSPSMAGDYPGHIRISVSEAKELGSTSVLDDVRPRAVSEAADEAGRLGQLDMNIPERKITGLRKQDGTLYPVKDKPLTGDIFDYKPPRDPTASLIVTETVDDVLVGMKRVDIPEPDLFDVSRPDFSDILKPLDEAEEFVGVRAAGELDHVDFSGPWGREGRRGILQRGRRRFDIKGRAAKIVEEVSDDVEGFDIIERDLKTPKTPWKFPDEVAKVDDVKPPSRPRRPSAEVTLKDEITAGVKPVTKVVKTTAPALGTPGVGGLAGMREARQRGRGRQRRRAGPPGEFDVEGAPPSAWSTPDLRGQEGWEKLNPFYVEPPKATVDKETKAETIQRRHKDRRRRREDAPQAPTSVDLLKDEEDAVTKPKDVTKPKHRRKQKPRPDQIPAEVPDQIPDVIQTPDVVPVEIPDIIQTPDVIPAEIVEPVIPAPPIPIVDVVQTQQQGLRRPPGWPQAQEPLRPFRYREPRTRRGRRPSFDLGRIDIFRTLRVGTPKQQLRGTFGRGIPGFGPPLKREQPTRKKKRKKRKGEEEGILGILFGG